MWFFLVLVALGVVLGCAYEQLRKEIRKFAPWGLIFFSAFAGFMIIAAVLIGSTILTFHVEGKVFRHEEALVAFSAVVAFAALAVETMRILECARAYRGEMPRRIRT